MLISFLGQGGDAHQLSIILPNVLFKKQSYFDVFQTLLCYNVLQCVTNLTTQITQLELGTIYDLKYKTSKK